MEGGRAPVLTVERQRFVVFRLAPLTARGGVTQKLLQPRETDLRPLLLDTCDSTRVYR